MNFFKLYTGDYQRDTAHLSITEHGAYLLMLQHYYATEKPLPVGKALHRMLRAQDKEEREAIDSVVGQFWHETPDGLVNKRADGEITKARAQADTNRQIAVQREARRKVPPEPPPNEHEKGTNRAMNGQPNHSQTPDSTVVPEERQEHTPRRGSAPLTVGADALIAEGVQPQHARDWLAARKAKRMPLTSSSWERTKREATKAGLSPAQAVQRCAEKGWAGFDADWDPARVEGSAAVFAGAQ